MIGFFVSQILIEIRCFTILERVSRIKHYKIYCGKNWGVLVSVKNKTTNDKRL